MGAFPTPQATPVVFAFASRGVLGYTLDKQGVNLPVDFAPWRSLGKRELHENAIKIKASAVMAGIERQGFYLVSVEPVLRDTLDNTGEMIADK